MRRALVGIDAQLEEITTTVSAGQGVLILGEPASGVSTLLRAFVDCHLEGGGEIAISLDEIEASTPAAVLVIDDIDRLDPRLVSDIAARLMAHRLVGVFGTTSPRSPNVARLTSATDLRELRLTPLDPDGVADLVFDLLHAYPDRSTALQLEAFSGGRIGVLVPVIDEAIARGAFATEAAVVRLRQPLTTPQSVASHINLRRAQLNAAADEVLQAVCVAQVLGVDQALRAFDPGAIAQAEQHGLLAVRDDNSNDVILPAIGAVTQAVLDELGHFGEVVTARLLLARVSNPSFEQKVYWQAVAGLQPTAPELVEAAAVATERGELRIAEMLATAAWQNGYARAGTLLAEVVAARGDRPAAARILEHVLVAPDIDDDERARAALELATIRLWNLGDARGAIDLATLLHQSLIGTEHEVAGAAALGGILLYAAQPQRALEVLTPFFDRGEYRNALACQVSAAALAVTGDCVRAVELAERGLELATNQSNEHAELDPEIHVLTVALALELAGQLDRADAILAKWYDAAARRSVHHGWLSLARMRVAIAGGDLTTAQRAADEAAAIFSDTDNQAPRRWAVAGKLLACALAGDVQGGAAALAQLELLSPGAVAFLEPDVIRATAWHAANLGRLGEARDLLHRACTAANETGLHSLESSVLHDFLRLGEPEAALARLESLEQLVDSTWSSARVLHARGLASDDPVMLLQASSAYGSGGAVLWAAEAAAQAVAICRAHRMHPASREATAALHRWMATGIDAVTPALSNTALTSLSKREREVARLAAAGHTSRMIAADLSVSVRTVDNHLQRIYVKLGVRSRAELRDWLTGNGRVRDVSNTKPAHE